MMTGPNDDAGAIQEACHGAIGQQFVVLYSEFVTATGGCPVQTGG